ncbi:MAG TPA: YceH family protein [Burkholderiaceae bacterium]|nr:YceH family protein [Burkholderiaceae bacterium]
MTDDQTVSAPAEESVLDPLEIRVLAVLAEKEALTPDNYPLSLNTLTTGCNQLSSRDPVMSVDEPAVQQTLLRLIEQKLVNEVQQAGARVTKYEHRLRIKWTLPQDKLAILVMLMLRGVQTAGEVRSRSGRLHEFASIAEVEEGLQFLIDKYPPLVARLERTPGSKEVRYAHLLAGAGTLALQQAAAASSARSPVAGRDERVAQLEQEVASLRRELQELAQQFERFKQQFD